MSNKKPTSVLVDTSFLIALYDDKYPNHMTAKKYYKYCLDHSITLYISTIVVSEFHQGQPITDIIASGDYRLLPFNFDDAISTADSAYQLGGLDRRGQTAAKCKDDLKLIGQAKNNEVDFIITEDVTTLYRYCERLNGANLLNTKPIALKDGFDPSWFNNGQASLIK